MVYLPQVKQIHTAADAPGDGAVLKDNHWRDSRGETVQVWVIDNGVTSFNLQPKQSMDGTTYFNVGSAISTAGVTEVTGIKMPYFKVELTAIVNNGSDIDVHLA